MYTKNYIQNGLSVKVYRGDAKTLLAFNLPQALTRNLAGFTVSCLPQGNKEYYLFNQLQFAIPKLHAQDANEPPNSSINAPFQKYYWVHVPGNFHQGNDVFYGLYNYTVTPRYFDDKGILQSMDKSQSVSVAIQVAPFTKGAVEPGFTRGFVQSQAFVHHFGNKTPFKPQGKALQFDTSAVAGKNDAGESFTFLDEYKWSGFTARNKIFSVLNEVINDVTLKLDVFAYDLNEPDVVKILVQLAQQGRIRMILDNATLHHDSTGNLPEDQFEDLFNKNVKGEVALKRGKFGRFSHDKILIVYKDKDPKKVLFGSTNFSVTGMYVNSNHVVIYNDASVAQTYATVFEESWNDDVKMAFSKSSLSSQVFSFGSDNVPKTNITFSPHQPTFALSNLKTISDRITAEKSSVLFAVMDLDPGTGPILLALEDLHSNQNIFSYGISDSPGKGITLYKPGNPSGILVSGKPGQTKLPPPFDQEEPISGLGHQIHHKFVICDFNGPDAVTYCGSSNLAQGGEEANGDNLVAIYDQDISTVFAIEAFGLVDHFNFRDKFGLNNNPAIPGTGVETTTLQTSTINSAADSATKPMTLGQDDLWTKSYYDVNDAHCKERLILS